MKYIFVDLDETLIHTTTYRRNAPIDIRSIDLGDGDVSDPYYAELRPGAMQLLSALRAIPDSRVMMLTTAVTAYAEGFNREFNLGFEDREIFAREDMIEGGIDAASFSDAKLVALIDDRTRQYHRQHKIPFLSNLIDSTPSPDENFVFIQVPEFLGSLFRVGGAPKARDGVEFTPEAIADIVRQLT